MTLLDANYILRWFLKDVPTQTAVALKLLETSPSSSLLVDRVNIAEVTYVLRLQGYSHQQVAVLFRLLYLYEAVRLPSNVDRLALAIYESTNLDFEDCILTALHQLKGHQIATFDRALQKQLAR